MGAPRPTKPHTLGARIREARTKAGLKQCELGALVGLRQRRIGDYELGECPIHAEHVEAIAKALGTTVERLMDGDGK